MPGPSNSSAHTSSSGAGPARHASKRFEMYLCKVVSSTQQHFYPSCPLSEAQQLLAGSSRAGNVAMI